MVMDVLTEIAGHVRVTAIMLCDDLEGEEAVREGVSMLKNAPSRASGSAGEADEVMPLNVNDTLFVENVVEALEEDARGDVAGMVEVGLAAGILALQERGVPDRRLSSMEAQIVRIAHPDLMEDLDGEVQEVTRSEAAGASAVEEVPGDSAVEEAAGASACSGVFPNPITGDSIRILVE